MKTISAVVATRNSAKTIDLCLSSLHPYMDVVVVDGYSKDDTLEIAERYGVRICMERGKGFFGAYDVGYRETSSDYVMFIDSDAYLRGFDFQKALSLFEDPKVGMVVCLARTPVNDWMTKALDELAQWRGSELMRYSQGGKLSWAHRQARKFFMSRNLGAGSTTTGPCYIIKDDVVKAIGGINTKADDFVLGKILKAAGYESAFYVSNEVYHIAPPGLRRLCHQWAVWGIRGAQTAKAFYTRRERTTALFMFALGGAASFLVGARIRDVRYSVLMPFLRALQLAGFIVSSLLLNNTVRNYNGHKERETP